MGLLDSLLGSVLGGQSGGGMQQQGGGGLQGMLLQAVMGMISNRQGGAPGQGGGLQDLIGMFRQAGLGQHMDSWISTGENMPISGDQIQQVLGSDRIAAMAQQFGIAPDAVSSALAQLLPHVVDQVTPQGQVPSNDLLEQGLNLLKGRLLGG